MSAPMAHVFAGMKFLRFSTRFMPLARQLSYQSQCRCMCAMQSAWTGSVDVSRGRRQHSSLSEQFIKATTEHTIPTSSGIRPIFRTTENNPAKHRDNHVGLFYTVSPTDFTRWMKDGMDYHYYRMCKSFTENCVMVRKPATEVMQCMQLANYDMPTIRYLLYGRKGSGKSTTLAHIMHSCGVNGWVVLHVPWAMAYNRYSREIQLSTHSPGLVDQPLDAVAWISNFKQMNGPVLQELQPTASEKYVWSKREVTEEGSSLLQAIDFALGRAKYATDVMGMILKEMKLQASAKKFRVLVAVDGVNALWQPTIYKKFHNKHQKYVSDDLAIAQFWRKMVRNDWSNGAVVCTTDSFVNMVDDRDSYMPLHLLGKEGFELLDPMIPIHVPAFTEKEALSMIEYYTDRKWIHSPREEDRKEIMFLSGCNPYEVYSVCRGW